MSKDRFYFYPQELESIKSMHPGLYESMKNNIVLLDSPQRTELKNNLNESLGAIASEYGYGVAQSSDVSGLRGLSQSPITIHSDETHNLAEIYDSGEPSLVTQKWLEHRRICRRALLECLSGESYQTD
jgi:hypothetical protein